MLDILSYTFMQRAILASILGGMGCGIVGVWIVMLRIPFVGVAMSHAAFAGAILGLLLGINPLTLAIILCLGSSFLIGPLSERGEFDPNVSLGIIFSIMLGIAFLGMGFLKGPKTEALRLLWGSILTISPKGLSWLGIITSLLILFSFLFFKETTAILFNREIARAVGIPERAIFYSLLFLSGLTVTLNLSTIGGLLIFSLIINPPSAAYQLTYNLKTMFLLSIIFGISSCLLGLLFSYLFNAPSGAVIIIVSSLIFGFSLLFSPKKLKPGLHS